MRPTTATQSPLFFFEKKQVNLFDLIILLYAENGLFLMHILLSGVKVNDFAPTV